MNKVLESINFDSKIKSANLILFKKFLETWLEDSLLKLAVTTIKKYGWWFNRKSKIVPKLTYMLFNNYYVTERNIEIDRIGFMIYENKKRSYGEQSLHLTLHIINKEEPEFFFTYNQKEISPEEILKKVHRELVNHD